MCAVQMKVCLEEEEGICDKTDSWKQQKEEEIARKALRVNLESRKAPWVECWLKRGLYL